MKNFTKSLFNLLFLVVTFSLVACGGGGGGGGGNTAPTAATITADNAESLAIAASESTQEAVVNESAQGALPFSVPDSSNDLEAAVSRKIAQLYLQQLSATGLIITGDCGGSINIPETATGTITFNGYCTPVPGYGNMIMNGSVTYSYNDPYVSLTYSNFTVSFGGETQTINMSMTVNINTGEITYNSSFVSSSGVTLSYTNFEFTGNAQTGVTVTSGQVTYSGIGYFNVYTESPVVLSGCSNGRPMSGIIVAEGSNSTMASITFDGCDSYTLCYDLNDGAGLICDTGMW